MQTSSLQASGLSFSDTLTGLLAALYNRGQFTTFG